MATNVIVTGKVSLGIQFAVAAFDAYVLMLPRSREVLLRDLLKVELGVQMVEFLFYLWMVRQWKANKSLKRILQFRYCDWIITTPTMLMTLTAFLGGTPEQSLFSFIQQHFKFLIQVLLLNLLMLWFGLQGEWGNIPPTHSVLFGFIPFILYFAMIYKRFVKNKQLSPFKIRVFYYFFFIWSLYGVIGFFPPVVKNIGYNILDLFSKNAVGLVLSFLLLHRPPSLRIHG